MPVGAAPSAEVASVAQKEAVVGAKTATSTTEHQNLAKRIRENMGKNRDARSLSDALNTVEPMDEAKGKASVDRNFGTKREDDGKRDFTGEAAAKMRSENEDAALKFARSIGTKRFEDLTTGGSASEVALLEAQFTPIISSIPGFEDFASRSQADRYAVYKEIMKDPAYLAKLKEGYGTHIGKSLTDREEAVATSKQEMDAASATLEFARKEQERADGEYNEATDRERYLKSGEGAAKIGRAGEATLKARKAKDAYDFAKAARDNLLKLKASKEPPTDIDAQIETASGKVNDALTELDTAEGEVREINRLIKELDDIPQRLKTAKESKAKADKENVDAIGKHDVARRKYLDARREKEAAEIDHLAEGKNLTGEALKAYLLAKEQEAAQAAQEVLVEMESEAKDEVEGAMANLTNARYFTVDRKGGLHERTDMYKKDTAYWFDPKGQGPQAVVRDMLNGHFNKQFRAQYTAEGKTGTDLDAAVGKATQEAVDAKMRDQEFVNKWTRQVLEQSLKGFARNKGHLTEAQYTFIERQPWGGQVQEILNGSPEVNEAVEQAKEKGIIKNDEGIKDLLKKKGMLGLLLAIAAGAITSSVGFIGLGSGGSEH